jgi:TetR/AcrR family transcriptional repressor of mexJK operon
MTQNNATFPVPQASPQGRKTAGRPRASEVEGRRAQLLAVAGTLFLRHGYRQVSLELIAREAGVAVRTIYQKYDGKIGLFNAVVENVRNRCFRDLPILAEDMRPLRQVLESFALRYVTLISLPEVQQLTRMVIVEAPQSPDMARDFYLNGPGYIREQLMLLFSREDIQSKHDFPADAGTLVGHLLACLGGSNLFNWILPARETLDEFALQQRAMSGLDMFFLSMG